MSSYDNMMPYDSFVFSDTEQNIPEDTNIEPISTPASSVVDTENITEQVSRYITTSNIRHIFNDENSSCDYELKTIYNQQNVERAKDILRKSSTYITYIGKFLDSSLVIDPKWNNIAINDDPSVSLGKAVLDAWNTLLVYMASIENGYIEDENIINVFKGTVVKEDVHNLLVLKVILPHDIRVMVKPIKSPCGVIKMTTLSYVVPGGYGIRRFIFGPTFTSNIKKANIEYGLFNECNITYDNFIKELQCITNRTFTHPVSSPIYTDPIINIIEKRSNNYAQQQQRTTRQQPVIVNQRQPVVYPTIKQRQPISYQKQEHTAILPVQKQHQHIQFDEVPSVSQPTSMQYTPHPIDVEISKLTNWITTLDMSDATNKQIAYSISTRINYLMNQKR